MVKTFFLLFFSVQFLLGTQCGGRRIEKKRDHLYFYNDAGEVFKEVSVGRPILSLECFDDVIVGVVTDEAVFVTSSSGELVMKKVLPPGFDYAYKMGNAFVFKGKGQFFEWSLSKDGSIHTHQYFAPLKTSVLFLSTNDQEKVLFFGNRMQLSDGEHPIIPLRVEKNAFWYLDLENIKLYRADTEYFRHKEDVYAATRVRDLSQLKKIFVNLSVLQMRNVLRLFPASALQIPLMESYLKRIEPKQADVNFLFSIADPEHVVQAMKTAKRVEIPFLGRFSLQHANELSKALARTFNSGWQTLLYKYGKFDYRVKYPENRHDGPVVLTVFVEGERLFEWEIPFECEKSTSSQVEEKHAKTFLSIPTVEYVSKYELTEYICDIAPQSFDQNRKFLQTAMAGFSSRKPFRFERSWKIEEKKHLYDVSSRQTAFGKAMSDAFSGSSAECFQMEDACKRRCNGKEDAFRFFIFSRSDRQKCEESCGQALTACRQGDTKQMTEYYCEAKCTGFSKEEGLLTSSDYTKCKQSCQQEGIE